MEPYGIGNMVRKIKKDMFLGLVENIVIWRINVTAEKLRNEIRMTVFLFLRRCLQGTKELFVDINVFYFICDKHVR
jgi:hypothetical protein